MNLAFRTDYDSVLIKALLKDQLNLNTRANLNISLKDEMLDDPVNHGTLERSVLVYFRQGLEIMSAIRQIVNWKFQNLANVNTFLDFACGYGRSSRFLVTEIAPSCV